MEKVRAGARASLLRAARAAGSACLLVLVLLALPAPSQPAPPHNPTEYEVKAAYLYNFGKFVKWPDSAAGGDTFPICVLGRDPFSGALDSTVQGESIGGKPIQARRVAEPQDAASCRIVYVSPSEGKHLKEVLSALKKASALTVSDIPGFSSDGGMIEFVNDNGRVRFQVNLEAAKSAGLTLSSELLKVATKVTTGSAGGS